MESEKIIKSSSELQGYDPSLFKVTPRDEAIHDQAFETKPVGFLRGAMRRFAKSKASIVAGIIILLIALFAIIVPFTLPTNYVDPIAYPNGFEDQELGYLLPYNKAFEGTGFWDGTEVVSVNERTYQIYKFDEGNRDRLRSVEGTTEYRIGSTVYTSYSLRIDSYAIGVKQKRITRSQYEALYQYDVERGTFGTDKSIIKPMIDIEGYLSEYSLEMAADGVTDNIARNIVDQMRTFYTQNPRVYYKITAKQENGNYSQQANTFRILYADEAKTQIIPLYVTNEAGEYVYYQISSNMYDVRFDYFDYFTFVNGYEPIFAFGTNASGQDLLLRLAKGTRFSLLLGIGISLINFCIGLIWGAISGYYGGRVDLIMERVTDIISALPSVIILTICGIQFTNNTSLIATIGRGGVIVLAFLVAFVYSGWIGTAATTRMQFYRYKGQEYVLASRTLGAKDRRLIFRHILPNAAGTLVTSSVLMIPSVIFSESSLSYLGIIDFKSSGLSSIGTLLNEGQNAGIQNYPYLIIFPCIVIALLMICFNLFGNGLRDAFNTTLRGAED